MTEAPASSLSQLEIVVPAEIFDTAAESMGRCFEPISKVDRLTSARDFLDLSKSFKQAEIIKRYTHHESAKLLEVGSGFGTNLAVWLIHFNVDAYGVEPGGEGGDSISAFAGWAGGSFRRVIAFEADPVSFEKLRGFLLRNFEVGRSRALPFAVGQRREKLRFAASGEASAALTSDGGVEVECVTLDEVLEDEQVTFIKMDIEGAEEAALLGGKRIIGRDHPLLALCVYHRIDHLWRIPLMAHDAPGDSRVALRSYCLDGLDTVCHAVPPGRWRASAVSV